MCRSWVKCTAHVDCLIHQQTGFNQQPSEAVPTYPVASVPKTSSNGAAAPVITSTSLAMPCPPHDRGGGECLTHLAVKSMLAITACQETGKHENMPAHVGSHP